MAEKAKKKAWWQKLIIALGIAAIVIVVFFGAVIGYFRVSVASIIRQAKRRLKFPVSPTDSSRRASHTTRAKIRSFLAAT